MTRHACYCLQLHLGYAPRRIAEVIPAPDTRCGPPTRHCRCCHRCLSTTLFRHDGLCLLLCLLMLLPCILLLLVPYVLHLHLFHPLLPFSLGTLLCFLSLVSLLRFLHFLCFARLSGVPACQYLCSKQDIRYSPLTSTEALLSPLPAASSAPLPFTASPLQLPFWPPSIVCACETWCLQLPVHPPSGSPTQHWSLATSWYEGVE